MINRLIIGDCRDVLKTLPDNSIQSVITSPPYYNLRDYGVAGQIGLESTYQEYVQNILEVFREVKRVLKDDGTLWLNLGDSYTGSGHGGEPEKYAKKQTMPKLNVTPCIDLKPKNLIGIPWRVAFALQADGWHLRQDIIWHKPNAMPESVRDRCTTAHEYIFLFSKSKNYYFDYEAIQEACITHENRPYSIVRNRQNEYKSKLNAMRPLPKKQEVPQEKAPTKRNKRSVWTVNTRPYKGAHFAAFPPSLIQPCILAGTKAGDIILDPFFGSGTVAEVAALLRRNWIGIEINPEYKNLYKERLGLFALSKGI